MTRRTTYSSSNTKNVPNSYILLVAMAQTEQEHLCIYIVVVLEKW